MNVIGTARATADLLRLSRIVPANVRLAVIRCGQRNAQALRRSAKAQRLGRVARSIQTTITTRNGNGKTTAVTGIKAGARARDSKGQTIDAATLGRLAENGTKARHTAKGHNRGAMPATPWVRPAAAQTAAANTADLVNAARG